jgi:hypothetical protein
MTRKKDVIRPYTPDYCARESLAYRLDCSTDKVDADVKSGLLPPPEIVGTMQRWHWAEVVAFIKARNGKLGDSAIVDAAGHVVTGRDADPFSQGVMRAKTANA